VAAGAFTPCACRPTHRGRHFDPAPLNRPAEARLAARDPAVTDGREVDCLIVPGFTPRFGWRGGALHPAAEARCRAAARDLALGVAPLAIVSGGAVHGPDNEALLLRDSLLSQGVRDDRILVEPCACHTTTNLRNAARIMLAHGLRDAFIVTDDAPGRSPRDWLLRARTQAAYVGFPRLSGFALRCRLTLGYSVGALAWERPMHVRFVPSRDCLRTSALPSLEGDP